MFKDNNIDSMLCKYEKFEELLNALIEIDSSSYPIEIKQIIIDTICSLSLQTIKESKYTTQNDKRA